ncbi:KilA-N domain-containing protein [Candidatus Symbiobacter mobilis]|uniref:KilA domain protein n=1 Tax=Candidatus Symbiobacter mobilis CR TaxID=946483 RepID=U5N981_9BURK|nr:KilA-N domain-containing protein [Candidatus Symbiobacter mobilis]AGX86818.1 KilA domain protein [Candidatus Symbiobacter mobilis CR]
MSKAKRTSIEVQGTSIAMLSHDRQDFLCLTDIAKLKNPDHSDDVIRNWLRSRSTVEFLGVWERLNNPAFNPVEFDGIKSQTGLNSFVLTPKQWIEQTGAIGLRSSAGRYGGTYAHKDIAFEFASWVSVEFKLYLIKETLIPPSITTAQASLAYASEADLLNVALFGQTAKQWRDAHPEAEGNLRDHAPLEQLVVLTNLESLNSVLIRQGLLAPERLLKLNEIAITQMRTLLADTNLKRLQ